jgi:dihydroorotase
MYPALNGRGKMNPPLRNKLDQDILWSAMNNGIIDTIGSDHAPHLLGEKEQPLCKCPSGVPGIETTLPLLITAWRDGKIELNKIVELLHDNPQRIFNLAQNDDLVLVDIVNQQTLKDENMASKCKWTPFVGMELIGFPRYVYTNQRLIDCREI